MARRFAADRTSSGVRPACGGRGNVSLTRPLEWLEAIDFTDASAAAARVAQEFTGWAPELTALITDSDTDPVLRPHYALPADHHWARIPGVTLVADAAHVMPPNGEGANLAMLDGTELAQALAAHPGDVEGALTAFKQAMFGRSAAPRSPPRALRSTPCSTASPTRKPQRF